MGQRDMTTELPLRGVRVLDLSRVLAGPWCGMVLGDLGAEVIKIEHPRRGDDTRDWGVRADDTRTAYFNSANRNKRSVGIDLQTPAGQELALSLASRCDVVIQNFRFGGAEKLGLGHAQVRAVKPDVVYCSISGYDRTGAEAARPGYDLVIQGETGLMSINGEQGQRPLKFGMAVVDLFTGMYAAQAVMAALFDRQRTGSGRHVELALYDCGLMISAYCGLEALLNERDPPRYGNSHPSIVPYGVFEAQDGPLVITVGNNAQFQRFCRDVIERPDLAGDERYATNTSRTAHRQALLEQLVPEIAARSRGLLLERLCEAEIPCGEVLGLLDALQSEGTASGGLLTPRADGVGSVFAPPYRLDGGRPEVRLAPPSLGEGTRDVLGGLLGLDAEALEALARQQVI